MRKVVGGVVLALGGFLLVAAVLGSLWAPGVVKKTPLDVNTTTRLSGTAAKLDTATGDFTARPIYVKSVTQVDADKSTDSTDVFVATSCAVFDTGTGDDCVEGSDPNLITASIDVFAEDRVTALAADSKNLPDDAVPHEGLVNKFPFDTEKKTYPYWDGTVGRAVDATYVRTEEVAGVETYVFQAQITDEPIEIAAGIPGTYTDLKTIYVEPKTGAIQNQTDDQQRYLADGTQVLDLQAGFTDAQIATFAKDAKTNVASLGLLTRTIPLVGFVGGAVLVALGVLLLVTARRRTARAPVAEKRVPVGAGR